MSDKIKQTVNKVVLTGKVAEFETMTGKNKDGIPYVSVKGAIQFGDSKAQTKRFEKYSQEVNKKGKESKAYPKVVAFANKVKSIAKESYDEATEVSVQGAFATNDYVNDKEELKETVKIDAAFFNDVDADTPYGANADIEGYIYKIIPETKGVASDADETGRLRVTVLTTDFFGNIIPVKNIIVPKELKEGFEDGYEIGQTAKLYVDFILNKTESKPKKSGGIGVQRETDGKSYVEMILTGADPAIDEDEVNAISKEAIKIALMERKSMLQELEEEGYKGGKKKSISSSAPSSKNKPAPANDEDIPF